MSADVGGDFTCFAQIALLVTFPYLAGAARITPDDRILQCALYLKVGSGRACGTACVCACV